MNQINGTIQVQMTLNDANYINELLERDRAKAIRTKTIAGTDFEECPACGELITLKEGVFCIICGQRLDRDNKAF